MRRLLSTIAPAILAGALVAPAAQAARPDHRAGVLGPGGAAAPAIAAGEGDGPGAAARPEGRWPLATSKPPFPGIAAPGDGFRWRNAAVAAGVTLGALILAATLALAVRHRRPTLDIASPLVTNGRSS